MKHPWYCAPKTTSSQDKAIRIFKAPRWHTEGRLGVSERGSEWVSGWREWVSEWVSEWVTEGASELVGGWVSGWENEGVSERLSERGSEWVSGWERERESEWVSVTEGASELVGEWVGERVREWVRERVSEWVSGWVSDWGSEWASEWVSKWVSKMSTAAVKFTAVLVLSRQLIIHSNYSTYLYATEVMGVWWQRGKLEVTRGEEGRSLCCMISHEYIGLHYCILRGKLYITDTQNDSNPQLGRDFICGPVQLFLTTQKNGTNVQIDR